MSAQELTMEEGKGLDSDVFPFSTAPLLCFFGGSGGGWDGVWAPDHNWSLDSEFKKLVHLCKLAHFIGEQTDSEKWKLTRCDLFFPLYNSNCRVKTNTIAFEVLC